MLIAFLVALAACRSLPVSDNQRDTTAAVTEQRHPRTVAAAVAFTIARMSSDEKAHLRAVRRDEMRGLLHGFQMTARNEYGLTAGNPDLLRSCGSETMVLEDCLLVILEAIWLELNKQQAGGSARALTGLLHSSLRH